MVIRSEPSVSNIPLYDSGQCARFGVAVRDAGVFSRVEWVEMRPEEG